MKADRAWHAALGQLQMEMPKAAFDTWVSNTEFISYEDGSFIIGVQNAYARDWLESRLSSTVRRTLTGMMNRTVEVNFIVWQGLDETVQPKAENESQVEEPFEDNIPSERNASLNQRYTFENFVVGASNRLAHAASLAVAERPAHAYNPLFATCS
jgi:chromosomal replication initiator protein